MDSQTSSLDLEKNKISIVIVKGEQYKEARISLLEPLLQQKMKCIYLTFDLPYKSLSQELQARKIDGSKISFIDAITEETTKAPNCVFVGSPAALTNISIAITQKIDDMLAQNIRKDKIILIFDSLSGLSQYIKPNTLMKFMHSILNKIRTKDAHAIILLLEGQMSEQDISSLLLFCDNMVRYGSSQAKEVSSK